MSTDYDDATLQALFDTPAMTAPDGVTANFDDPPNQNGLAIAVLTLCLVISSICVMLRFYARVWLLRRVQAEEVLIFLGYGCFIAQMVTGYLLIKEPGYFVHQYNLKMKNMVSTSFNVLIMGCFYQLVLPLLKTAILMEWIRLLVPPGNRIKSFFWWGCVTIITVQIGFGIACLAALNMQCTPHESIWKFWLSDRKCWDLVRLQLASGSIQLISDVCMLLLPQKTIWTLRLSWQKRLGVSVVFSLGVLACVSAAVRLSSTVNYGYDDDQMYALGPLVFWVDAESTCAFFICCIPCLPKILKDQGVLRKIKLALGMKVSTNGTGGYGSDLKGGSKYGLSSKYGNNMSRPGGAESYRKLDEESGIAMRTMKSESTEQLRHPDSDGKIMRTTQVTIERSQETASHSDSDHHPERRKSMKGATQQSWYS